jgi:hypothetical protein
LRKLEEEKKLAATHDASKTAHLSKLGSKFIVKKDGRVMGDGNRGETDGDSLSPLLSSPLSSFLRSLASSPLPKITQLEVNLLKDPTSLPSLQPDNQLTSTSRSLFNQPTNPNSLSWLDLSYPPS